MFLVDVASFCYWAYVRSEILKFLKEFAYFYDYVQNVGLRTGYQNPKRKLGVTTHSSEVIELKFGKRFPYILFILKLVLEL